MSSLLVSKEQILQDQADTCFTYQSLINNFASNKQADDLKLISSEFAEIKRKHDSTSLPQDSLKNTGGAMVFIGILISVIYLFY